MTAYLSQLNCAGKIIDLTSPKIMGVINVTPDSFYSESRKLSLPKILHRAAEMQAEGAAVIDLGGESTRPGSQTVSLQEELDRIVPVVEALSREIDLPISVDTYKPEVMRAAIASGATLINDVRALQLPGALDVIAETNVAVCLMHMQGDPHTMQRDPAYEDVVVEVRNFLTERVKACLQAGIKKEHIIIDPGFGFGKTAEHNFQLLNRLDDFRILELPILVGWSRKTTVGKVLNQPPAERLYGSLAAAVLCAVKGAVLIRAHDVRPTVEAVKMAMAIIQEKLPQE